MVAGSPLGVKRDFSFSLNLSRARRGKSIRSVIRINATSNQITHETRLKISSKSGGVKVKIFDKSNNLVNEFSSIKSTAKFLNVSRTTIRNIIKTGVSYDNYIYKIEETIKYPIVVVNKENNTTKDYYSIRSVAKDIGVST
jgi:hypothetical protein